MKAPNMTRPPGFNMRQGTSPNARHIPVLNAGGTAIKAGTALIYDFAHMIADSAIYVTTTTAVNSPLTMGVAATTIPANGASGGFACILGPVKMALKANSVNVAAGDLIGTGAVAGYGYKAGNGRAIGFALAASTADAVLGTVAGYTLVYVTAAIDQTNWTSLTSTATELNSLHNLASGRLIVGSAGAVPTSVAMSGDATIIASGALTIAANAVSVAKLAAAVQQLLPKATITFGAIAGHKTTVTVTVTDAAGTALAAVSQVKVWVGSASMGAVVATSNTIDNVAAGTVIETTTAGGSLLAVTEAVGGTFVFDLSNSGSATRYVMVSIGGRVYASTIISL